MIGIDTNIVVRLLTNDEPGEAGRARALLSRERAFLATTVVLETEWVLRSAYEYSPAQISVALRKLLQVATVEVEDRARVERALDWHEIGLDFADALHLATISATPSTSAFATFDRKLSRRAARIAAAPTVVTP